MQKVIWVSKQNIFFHSLLQLTGFPPTPGPETHTRHCFTALGSAVDFSVCLYVFPKQKTALNTGLMRDPPSTICTEVDHLWMPE